MIDQTKVTSGFDVEVLLQSGYLQQSLLLACDSGLIPVEMTFSDRPGDRTAHGAASRRPDVPAPP